MRWLMCFRYKLEEQEGEIENLEVKLEKILKLATASTDSGRQFVVNQRWVTSEPLLLISYLLSSRIPPKMFTLLRLCKRIPCYLHASRESSVVVFNWINFLVLLIISVVSTQHRETMSTADKLLRIKNALICSINSQSRLLDVFFVCPFIRLLGQACRNIKTQCRGPVDWDKLNKRRGKAVLASSFTYKRGWVMSC